MLIQTGQDVDTTAEAEEAARVEEAKASLVEDQGTAEDQGESLILGKYKTYEDLEKAHASLQQEYSRLKNGQSSTVPDAKAETGSAGTEKQNTTDSDSGISEEIAQATVEALVTQAGGQDQYAQLTRWASAYVDPERIDAYNKALTTGDKDAALTALKAMQYDMLQHQGYQPSLLTGARTPGNSGVKPFESEQQLVDAMSDPRYRGSNPDPAYIREVERRVAASDNVFATR